MPREAWSITSEIELRIARGEDATALQPLLTELFAAQDANGFKLASLARQLDEIWEIDPSAALLVMLGQKTLASGKGEVVLPRTPDGYERTFGTEFPIPIGVYEEGLDRARLRRQPPDRRRVLRRHGVRDCAAQTCTRHSTAGWSSSPTSTSCRIRPAVSGKPQAEEMEAHFDGVAGPEGKALSVRGLRAIWRSPRGAPRHHPAGDRRPRDPKARRPRPRGVAATRACRGLRLRDRPSRAAAGCSCRSAGTT